MKSSLLILLFILSTLLGFTSKNDGFVILTTTVANAQEKRIPPTDKLLDVVDGNVRKFLSTHVYHYWAWMRKYADQYLSESFLVSGVVIGDPHLKNISNISDENHQQQISVVDFDDGGDAPLLLDAVRLFTTLKVQTKLGLKYREMYDNYLEGLKGQAPEAPQSVTKILAEADRKLTQRRNQQNYLFKKTENGLFRTDKLDLVSFKDLTETQKKEALALKKIIQKNIFSDTQYSISDIGMRINETGSSRNLPRFWFLIMQKKSPLMILEFKQLSKPAVQYYAPQYEHSKRIELILKSYGPQLSEMYQVAETDEHTYWMRPRKSGLIDLDEKPFNSDDFQREWGLYLCQWLGYKQSQQTAGQQLYQAIKKNGDIKSTVESLSRDYLKSILKAR